MKNEKLFKRMNIQFFAEPAPGGDGAGGSGADEKVSKSDYDKLLKQYEAQKNRIDELTKNEKEYKKQIADKQTDEEKKAQENQEILDRLAEYENKYEDMSIERELVASGFEEDEVQQYIKVKNDKVALAKQVSTIIKKKLENAKKQWEQELLQKTKGVNGGGGETVDESVTSYINQKGNSQNKAREHFLNKK